MLLKRNLVSVTAEWLLIPIPETETGQPDTWARLPCYNLVDAGLSGFNLHGDLHEDYPPHFEE